MSNPRTNCSRKEANWTVVASSREWAAAAVWAARAARPLRPLDLHPLPLRPLPHRPRRESGEGISPSGSNPTHGMTRPGPAGSAFITK